MRLLIFSILAFSQLVLFGQNQDIYSKVRINLSQHEISEIGVLGLETDHGQFVIGQHLINVFNQDEIAKLREAGIPYRIEIPDMKKWYLQQASENIETPLARSGNCYDVNSNFDYPIPENYEIGSMGGYLTYEEFLAQIDSMADKFPHLISPKAQIGNILTHENRPIYWLRISDNPLADEEEPEVLYTALHHAREPNSLSQLIFFMWHVLENYETDPEIKFIVDNTELYFVPMVNPDGYIFNQATDPEGGGFWRKNRWRDNNGEAFGVDLNRNYGYQWAYDDQGSSPDPIRETYRGTSAFSEPETQAIKLLCEAHNFLLSMNYHTHGNVLIHPWGYEDGPTIEDDSFKAFGRAMNVENNFKVGTGEETVGYTVNGDSDDWMYGEQSSKNKIFSFTPEVGPSFWPNPSEIDYLNKTTVRMNLNFALLTHNYVSVKEESQNLFVGTDHNLNFNIKQAGLGSGTNTLTVSSSNPQILSIGNPYISNLNHLQEENMMIPFTVDPGLTAPTEVEFIVEIDNGFFTREQKFKKFISPSEPVVVFQDGISSDDNFTTDGAWSLTNEDFASSPTSYTDSPGGVYLPNRNDYVLYEQAFDLTNAIYASLNYKAKWNIEEDYDFVQIMVGTNPMLASMASQCGLYTNPGTDDQIENAPLYDGIQNEWVSESVNLEDFLGEPEVYIAFRIISDVFVEADGFYFDDLEVEVITELDTKTNESFQNELFSLIPNPTKDIFEIRLDGELTDLREINFKISDSSGKIISQGKLEDRKTLSTKNFPAGVYQIQLSGNDKILGFRKLVKI